MESNENEVDDRVDESAPVYVDGVCKVDLLRYIAELVGNILVNPTTERGVDIAERISTEHELENEIDDGLENEVAESVYYRGKRATDENTDCHINDIAASDEFLKFAEKLFHMFLLIKYYNKIIPLFFAFVKRNSEHFAEISRKSGIL